MCNYQIRAIAISIFFCVILKLCVIFCVIQNCAHLHWKAGVHHGSRQKKTLLPALETDSWVCLAL